VVAAALDVAPDDWAPGRRQADASRAVAAYLARRRFGYRAREVAAALGYASHGGVVAAVRRIETAGPNLRRTVTKLERAITND